jgi:hypothetical protein
MGLQQPEGGVVQQPAVIWVVLLAILLGAIGVALWLFSRQPEPSSSSLQAALPSSVEGWQRSPSGQRYDPETIFSYIDGHAEVYLAYGMRGCIAERYTGPDEQPDLILDIFEMGSPADAFGVFTHDTEGDNVGIGTDSRYRFGWLSFWQGSSFVSIVAEGESEMAEEATLELGRQVAALLPGNGEVPALVQALPPEDLHVDSVRYLHHPQILNTHLPVDPENLLDLGMDTEAALGTYQRGQDRAHLLIVDYPTEKLATQVEKRVCGRWASTAEAEAEAPPETAFPGCHREGSRLSVVLETTSEDWVASLLHPVADGG